MTERHDPRREDRYARRRREQRDERARRDRARVAAPTDDDWVAPSEDHDDAVRPVDAPMPLGDLLEDAVKQRRWQDRLRGADALGRWDDIVGRELAARCEPVRIAGGTLVLRAQEPAWATQLRYLHRDILQRVNAVLGAGTVTQIRVIVGAGENPPR